MTAVPTPGGQAVPPPTTPCRRSSARDRWESITWPGKPTAYPCAHNHDHCDYIGCVEHVDGMHVDSVGDAIVHIRCPLCATGHASLCNQIRDASKPCSCGFAPTATSDAVPTPGGLSVYERFIAEVEALTIPADLPAAAVVGELTRAVKRAQNAAEATEAGRWDEGYIQAVADLTPRELKGPARLLFALDHMPKGNPYYDARAEGATDE